MANEELFALTKEAFQESENPQDQDAVLALMFSKGVPFGKLKTWYKTVGIKEEFIADPSVVKEAITEYMDENGDSFEAFDEWSDVEDFVTAAVEVIDGSTEAQILRMVRGYCKESEIELPKKTKGSGGPRKRGGALAASIVDYCNTAETISTRGFYDAVLPAVKGPKNAHYYVGAFFSMIYAVKNGCSLDEANAAMKTMPELKLKDLEADVEVA